MRILPWDTIGGPYFFRITSSTLSGRREIVLFLDRDPKHFILILNYLRNGGRIHSDMLPRDVRSLRELLIECNFYELKHLENNVQRRIYDIQNGTFT